MTKTKVAPFYLGHGVDEARQAGLASVSTVTQACSLCLEHFTGFRRHSNELKLV